MSRVITRPKALLDGAPEASVLVVPNSSADLFIRNNEVAKKISTFIDCLQLLVADPSAPRDGTMLVEGLANHVICAVHGENSPSSEVSYGFGLGPDPEKEFIEISRREDKDQAVLSYAEILGERLLFRDPNTLSEITDPAKVQELYQLVAIGEDEAIWAT